VKLSSPTIFRFCSKWSPLSISWRGQGIKLGEFGLLHAVEKGDRAEGTVDEEEMKELIV